MKLTFEDVIPADGAGQASGRRGFRLAACLFLLLALLAAAAGSWFVWCNATDSQAAGEASGHILGNWDSLEITDKKNESVRILDGSAYIGIVEIPSLGIRLPVNQSWSLANAKTSPCRYTGSVAGSDLVIAAHNFDTQFGGLKDLENGDEVKFTDNLGVTYQYEVCGKETLEGTDVEKMQDGGWDLTLFTCTIGGERRVTVRCQYADTGAAP